MYPQNLEVFFVSIKHFKKKYYCFDAKFKINFEIAFYVKI